MRIAVLILGLILGAVMIARSLLIVTLTDLAIDPLASALGRWVMLLGLLWLVGVACILGLPVVSVITFAAAAALGLSLGFGQTERVAELALWGALSLVLVLLSVGGLVEKLRADERDAQLRAEITAIAESLER
jgi:hypothetical protein